MNGGWEPVPAPGCAGIDVDLDSSTVRLPAGVALDLGGIGKGRAADLVAEQLLADGAVGACVNVGGDVRVTGRPPQGDTWPIALCNELAPETDLCVVSLRDGGVATSTPLRRRWTRGDDEVHHLLDPRTGRPVVTDLASVTVLAGTAAWAEVLAKAAFLSGAGDALTIVGAGGGQAILLRADGTVSMSSDFAPAAV
jgi:thiamine biosynthesis lipoprotein